MFNRLTLGGAAILLLVSQTSAFADVTAEQVWEDWQAQAASYGEVMTADNVGRDGDTLVVSGLRIAMDIDGDGGDDASGILAEVRFQERGDGTVSISTSPDFDMIFDQNVPDGPNVSYRLAIDMAGMTMIASGDSALRRYDYVAPEVGLALKDLSVDEQQIEGIFDLKAIGLDGSYTIAEGEPSQIDASSNIERATINVDFADPEGQEGRIVVTGEIANITSTSTSTMLANADLADMAAMLAAGFAVEGTLATGPASYSVQASGSDGSTFAAAVSSATGALDFALDESGINYGGANTDVAIVVTGSDIPFPQIEINAAETGGRLAMPLTVSSTPQDFAFGLTLRDLAVSEMIWSMIDPAGALPRDPATLVIDTTGKANWNIDILSPEVQQGNFGSDVPGQLHALDLRNLQLAIAGALLQGTGSFTFDNTDMQTFPGMPKPVGKANFSLDGANALLDKLIAMGLIPAEQALGFRGMMGMFARPGAEPDSLVSEIELTPDGGISANGLRLR